MFLPKLSSYHTLENSQGSLDPLGLYSIADRLAGYLAPSLRERMKHPRYLTAIAVGSIICEGYSEEELAADEVSPPWQVYEWYVASAFVKKYDGDNNQLLGLPGREKTTTAKKTGVPLSATQYLKTPSVFGFHGVYRTLAKGIDLISDRGIGEFGIRLIDVWEQEQDLIGFRVGDGSNGKAFKKIFIDAVTNGLKAGKVDKPWNWVFYDTIAEKLAPKSPGKKETALLYEKLIEDTSINRKELIGFLISPEGEKALEAESEKEFHIRFLSKANEAKAILLAIQAYEKFSRLLFNAFYQCMKIMLKKQNKGSLFDFSKLECVQKAYKELPEAFKILDERLEVYPPEAKEFLERFMSLRESQNIQDWLKLLFDHHISVQKQKPPKGKAPWIMEHDQGNYLLNNTNALDQDLNDEYVHQYRTFTLQSFMKDLGKI